jgi:hypothetical protein
MFRLWRFRTMPLVALISGIVYGQDITMFRLRPLLSSFVADSTSPPEPFGYKMGWIAVWSTDVKAVAASIPLRSQSSASWHDGIAAAYKSAAARNDDTLFIAPPIDGWICLIGWWAAGADSKCADGRIEVETASTRVADLSSRFGAAQGYATHRVVEYHHWIRAEQGRVVRCFAYVGESGEVPCHLGSVISAETKLPYANLPFDSWLADQQDVMTVAGGWSFNPTKLSSSSGPAASGILGRLK